MGIAAEPRAMLAVTIVDWTTNAQLEHMYDRLLDRDANHVDWLPRADEKVWMYEAKVTPR